MGEWPCLVSTGWKIDHLKAEEIKLDWEDGPGHGFVGGMESLFM